LRNTNSKVNQKKCEFGAENARYLGYKLTQKEFCQGGTNWKLCRTVSKHSKQFKSDNSLGSVIFQIPCHKFCPNWFSPA
jgi:hypothetical protein